MDFENFKEKFMEDIKERLEDAGIDANITTNTVKKLNESYEAITITPNDSKVALTVKEAAEYSNIGINKLENLLRSPRCPFVLYVGKKKLVKRKEFEKSISDNIEL